MNRSVALTFRKQFVADTVVAISQRFMMIGEVALVVAVPVIAQIAELQEKLATVKQAAAENKQKLRPYQWSETQQLTLKGDAKPLSQNLCRYGPNGNVQKTAIGLPPGKPSGGKVKQRIIEKKKAEMKEYMQDVKVLLDIYIPPDPSGNAASLRGR